MATIDKIVCQWTGSWPGAPGYSVFYTSASQGASIQPKLITFWQTLASYLPSGFVINVPTSGVTLDEHDGKPVGNWSGGSVGVIPGGAQSAYSSVSGAQIRWDTGVFVRGHKVVGRTFIVPLYMNAYATGGILASTVTASIKGAADALKSTPGQLVVWSRPTFDNSTPPIMTNSGLGIPVVSTSVPTKVTYLRTRRD